MPYPYKDIEEKWRKIWEETEPGKTDENSDKPKFYCLVEFPYPSGAGLHTGHVRTYTALDVIARKRRMDGYNVLFPIGWDAFGLPTENYAIKVGRPPQDITKENIDTFREQFKSVGLSFDWSREVNTTDPNYYKWTQWQFLEFFKAGLAYKKAMAINWCLSCEIGLANEEVVGGVCERCGGDVEKRDKEQWMIAITKYADRLLEDLETVDYLPKIKKQQQDWIGRSEGINITYQVEVIDAPVTVYTTRPDTNFGATFVALAPDGEYVRDHLSEFPNKEEVAEYIKLALQKTDIDRIAEGREKTGVFTGLYATNKLNERKMPIYVADFVLGNVGTGSLVGVPGHDHRDFEFAQKMGIDIIRVVVGPDGDTSEITSIDQVQEEKGKMINSGPLDGMDIHDATSAIMDYIEKEGYGERTINYKIRDWVFSRQRYWGEPIPLVHCQGSCSPETNGWVAVPDEDLPVKLPPVESYEPTESGESPLAAIEDWVNTTCPTCGGPAKRETDTMPNWAGSSWYFLRYTDPHNSDAFASKEQLEKWMPVDFYNGGMEHTTLHLLYSRFWNKFLFDRGHVPVSEPYARRHSHGMVLAEDGSKMSKSKGNVINPNETVAQYGGDSLRLYELFMGPFEDTVPWNTNGVVGVRRFLEKVWNLQKLVGDSESEEVTKAMHRLIKSVGEDIEKLRFNTAVAKFMEAVNLLQQTKSISTDSWKMFVLALFPLAPFMTSELWEKVSKDPIHEQAWPSYDESFVQVSEVEIAVQVNGKLRASVLVSVGAEENEVTELAKSHENVASYIDGKEIKRVIFVKGRLINFVV